MRQADNKKEKGNERKRKRRIERLKERMKWIDKNRMREGWRD